MKTAKRKSTKGKPQPRQAALPLPAIAQWYTSTREAAKLIGVCYLTFNKYRNRGVIPQPDIILSQRRKGYSQEALAKMTRTAPYGITKKSQSNNDDQIGEYTQIPLDIEAAMPR